MAKSSDKNWKLTAYELERKPQNICDADSESAVTSRSLHKELMCPICLEILKKTMTTKECLHRFCADCIITALRSGNKECPTCRAKLVSKRSLRPDLNFDLLISKIYPNLDEYEAQHDRTIAKLNTSYMQTLAENVKMNEENNQQQSNELDNVENESEKRMRKRRKYFSLSEHLSNFQPDHNCESNSSMVAMDIYENNMSNESPSVPDEIEIILKPHPLATSVSIVKYDSRFIKTAANATVNHLKKYLTMRLNLDCGLNSSTESNNKSYLTMNNICIYIAKSSDHYITLNGVETLQDLENKFGNGNQALNMYYSLTEVINPPQPL